VDGKFTGQTTPTAADKKILRSLAGYKLIDFKYNNEIRAEINTKHVLIKQIPGNATGVNISEG